MTMNGLQEILTVLLACAALVLGVLVKILFERNRQVRSGFESRLQAVESPEGRFQRKLAEAGPAPLKRALSLAIHLDPRFWTETLQLTESELDEIKTRIYMPSYLSMSTAVEDFDKWFQGHLRVRIQEWQGGYTHIVVELL